MHIRRLIEHPCWQMSLRAGSAAAGHDPRAIRHRVVESIREAGCRCPTAEIDVSVIGDCVKVGFVWQVGQGAWLAFNEKGYQEIKVEEDNGQRPD
jgi:hypothetical protein